MQTTFAVLMLLCAAADATAQRPLESFDALLAVIEPGQKVIIQEDNGDSTRGEVVEMAVDRIDLTWRTWRFQRKVQSFSEPTVRTIRIVDSTWNGELIGLGAGIATGVLSARQCARESCMIPSLMLAVLAPAAGYALGLAIDSLVTEIVYESPRQSRLRLAAVVRPDRIGAGVQFAFGR